VNNEFENMWKEEAMETFQVMPQDLSGATEDLGQGVQCPDRDGTTHPAEYTPEVLQLWASCSVTVPGLEPLTAGG
jgi:hypothetical protein